MDLWIVQSHPGGYCSRMGNQNPEGQYVWNQRRQKKKRWKERTGGDSSEEGHLAVGPGPEMYHKMNFMYTRTDLQARSETLRRLDVVYGSLMDQNITSAQVYVGNTQTTAPA